MRRGARPGRGVARPVRHAGRSARTTTPTGCACRKPAPGLVHAAARALGTTADAVRAGRRHRRGHGRRRWRPARPGSWCRRRRPGRPRWPPRRTVAADLPAAVELILRRRTRRAARDPSPRPRRHGARGPLRLGRGRAGHRAGDPGGRGAAPSGWCCSAGHAAGPPPNCCPASTRSSSGRCRGSTPTPAPVDPDGRRRADRAGSRAVGADEAVVFTSFHQSAAAAGAAAAAGRVSAGSAAISDDYPGSPARRPAPGAGRACPNPNGPSPSPPPPVSRCPAGDEPALAAPHRRGAAAPAGRRPTRLRGAAPRLAASSPGLPAGAGRPDRRGRSPPPGTGCVVTGGPTSGTLTARVAAAGGVDLGGRTGLAELAAVIAGAGALVVGNTGPAHLAAALGVPVVSLFAPDRPVRTVGALPGADGPARRRRRALPGHPGHRLPGPRAPLPVGVDPGRVLDGRRGCSACRRRPRGGGGR